MAQTQKIRTVPTSAGKKKTARKTVRRRGEKRPAPLQLTFGPPRVKRKLQNPTENGPNLLSNVLRCVDRVTKFCAFCLEYDCRISDEEYRSTCCRNYVCERCKLRLDGEKCTLCLGDKFRVETIPSLQKTKEMLESFLVVPPKNLPIPSTLERMRGRRCITAGIPATDPRRPRPTSRRLPSRNSKPIVGKSFTRISRPKTASRKLPNQKSRSLHQKPHASKTVTETPKKSNPKERSRTLPNKPIPISRIQTRRPKNWLPVSKNSPQKQPQGWVAEKQKLFPKVVKKREKRTRSENRQTPVLYLNAQGGKIIPEKSRSRSPDREPRNDFYPKRKRFAKFRRAYTFDRKAEFKDWMMRMGEQIGFKKQALNIDKLDEDKFRIYPISPHVDIEKVQNKLICAFGSTRRCTFNDKEDGSRIFDVQVKDEATASEIDRICKDSFKLRLKPANSKDVLDAYSQNGFAATRKNTSDTDTSLFAALAELKKHYDG